MFFKDSFCGEKTAPPLVLDKTRKPVACYDTQGNLIKIFDKIKLGFLLQKPQRISRLPLEVRYLNNSQQTKAPPATNAKIIKNILSAPK
jgi:hypothetical protein